MTDYEPPSDSRSEFTPRNFAAALFKSSSEVAIDYRSQISYLYAAVLGREAREDEVAHWHAVIQSEIKSFPEVCEAILKSDEAKEQALNYAGRIGFENDLTTAIDHLYRIGLGRPASEADSHAWKLAVQRGIMSLSEVVTAILTSPEAESQQTSHRLQGSDLDAPPDEENELLRRLVEEHVDELSQFHQRLLGTQPTSTMLADWREDLQRRPTITLYLIAQVLDRAQPAKLAPKKSSESRTIGEAVKHIYKLAFNRIPVQDEINHWVKVVEEETLTVAEVICNLATSPEASQKRNLTPELSDGVFTQVLYELLLQRGANADDIAVWQRLFASGETDRNAMLQSLFRENALASAKGEVHTPNDATHTYLLGVGKVVDLGDWQNASINEVATVPAESRPFTRYHIASRPRVLVSAIASLYRGDAFIEQFLQNITNQTIFREFAELIIIDANSPENEFRVISKYLRDFSNIKYLRTPGRIGIYEAWNLGVSLSSGSYLTNTNMDDMRRSDSLELQAGVLEQLPFVDVVYQDVFYSFNSDLTFSQVAARGFRSSVPVITSQNLLSYNSPHNAPMWRRNIHDDVGMFDVAYRSAGDYDFWLRCKRKNKVFFKINDPHVVYYVNPAGISTRPDTRGIAESQSITKAHARALISDYLTSTPDSYCGELKRTVPTLPDLLQADPSMKYWRYTHAQAALRHLSRCHRAPALGEI